MSRTFLFLLTVGLILGIAAPGQTQGLINNFTAQAQGDSYILLGWSSGSETNLANFRVERSLDGIAYTTLTVLEPKGSNSTYSYEDHDIYRGSNRTYYYRIRAQMTNNEFFYSNVQSVVLFFSGIQQTWGSIKALFK